MPQLRQQCVVRRNCRSNHRGTPACRQLDGHDAHPGAAADENGAPAPTAVAASAWVAVTPVSIRPAAWFQSKAGGFGQHGPGGTEVLGVGPRRAEHDHSCPHGDGPGRPDRSCLMAVTVPAAS